MTRADLEPCHPILNRAIRAESYTIPGLNSPVRPCAHCYGRPGKRARCKHVNDWIHNLPIVWMGVVIFGLTYVAAAVLYACVVFLARHESLRSLKTVSPGILSPLGVLFGLFVAFTAVQVWNDNDRASEAVDREASSLKSVLVLATTFPAELQQRLHDLVASHIEEAVTREWPMMAHRDATLTITPQHLAQALQLTLAVNPTTPGQTTAQREMALALEGAFDARRQRILISRAEVSSFKWVCLLMQAACLLFAIGLLHCDDRLTAGFAMGIFASGTAVCLLLIAGYDRPFVGQYMVRPDPLLQVLPEIPGVGSAPPSTSDQRP